MRLRASLALAATGALTLVITACGGGPAGTLPTAPPGAVVVVAQGTAFTTQQVTAPANAAFTLFFENRDAEPHNVRLWDAANQVVFPGEIVTGPITLVEEVPALPAGTYRMTCDVHPNMTGQLIAG